MDYTQISGYAKVVCFWFTTYHSFLPDNRHPVLNPINPIWNLSKIISPHGFLFCAEGTIICPRELKVIAATECMVKLHVLYLVFL